MKVNNNGINPANDLAGKLNDVKSKTNKDIANSATDNTSNNTKAAELTSSTNLNISDKAKSRAEDFSRIKELASAAPDVDEAKVAKLRDLIEKNMYSVDADAIADKLVDEHAVDAIMEG